MVVPAGRPEPQVVFNLQPPHWTGSKQVCAVQEQSTGYLQPSSKTQPFSSPLMGLILVLGPRAGVSNTWLEPFTAQGGPLACPVTPPLLGHPLGLQVQTVSLFSSHKTIWFFFTAWFWDSHTASLQIILRTIWSCRLVVLEFYLYLFMAMLGLCCCLGFFLVVVHRLLLLCSTDFRVPGLQ